jgi:hypothetical protein
MMLKNAHECTRMRQNAPEYTRDHTHTNTREAGADSRPNSHGLVDEVLVEGLEDARELGGVARVEDGLAVWIGRC